MFNLKWFKLAGLALILNASAPAAWAQDAKSILVSPIADSSPLVKRALIIGVHDYRFASKLQDTTADAKEFARVLKDRYGFPDESITLMTDDATTPDDLKPTFTNLVNAVNVLVNGVNTNSEVVFFYSGHGARKDDLDYLVPQDGLTSAISQTCISYDDLKRRLETQRPHRALLFVDACRNLLKGKAGDGPSGFSGGGFNEAGMAELVSCQPTEISQEGFPEDFHQGVFTHFLLEGLTGAPEAAGPTGSVTYDSLKQFVQGKVSQYVTAKFHSSQNPAGKASLGGMVITRGTAPVEVVETHALLHVASTPPGARVFLDGDDTRKETPADLDIDLGIARQKDVEIGLNLPGYHPFVRKVTLSRGAKPAVELSLEPIATASAVAPSSTDNPSTALPTARQPITSTLWPPHPPAVEAGSIPTVPITAINPKDGAEMIYIPPGEFKMGDNDRSSYERPQRKVYLDAYWIYKNDVTVARYRKFCQETGRNMPRPPDWGWKDDHPIVNVGWQDAKAYCDWAGVSLPTEAQWEKAARGVDGRRFPWGNVFLSSNLWCSKTPDRDAGSTAPVASFPTGASPYGCLDMAGNVWNWCADWYADYDPNTSRNPTGPGFGTDRVVKGSSWEYAGLYEFRFCCFYRDESDPTSGGPDNGFRGCLRAGSS